MTRIFAIIFVQIVLLSCRETFKNGDVEKFNTLVANRTDIKKPQDLIELYYGPYKNKEAGSYKIIIDDLKDNKFKITFIRDWLNDDSVWGEKIVMYASLIDSTWKVSEIRLNWKCQKGRGHQHWSKDLCD